MSPSVTLRPGKDKALNRRHPWIFSGAIAKGAQASEGELLPVFSHDGKQLATAYFNHRCNIRGRIVAWGDDNPLQAIKHSLDAAISWRQQLFKSSQTTGYRLVNGEGDGLPGLVVDRFGEGLVVQISTLGMAQLKEVILTHLCSRLNIEHVYEKSTMPSRQQEGLKPESGWLKGGIGTTLPFIESGLHYFADLEEGQKTGFFLDQRGSRKQVQEIAQGHSVLNCFCYSGAFSLAALAGGADTVTSVDISGQALKMLDQHLDANAMQGRQHQSLEADVFDYLRQSKETFSLIILDPPAFVKKRKDVVAACRGYKDINRLAFQRLKPGGLLLSCSCSHYVDDTLFQKVLYQAALEAGCHAHIVGRHQQAPDHPENLFHPEGRYLKSFLVHKPG